MHEQSKKSCCCDESNRCSSEPGHVDAVPVFGERLEHSDAQEDEKSAEEQQDDDGLVSGEPHDSSVACAAFSSSAVNAWLHARRAASFSPPSLREINSDPHMSFRRNHHVPDGSKCITTSRVFPVASSFKRVREVFVSLDTME